MHLLTQRIVYLLFKVETSDFALNRQRRRCFSVTSPSKKNFGGGERNRTDDLMLAKHALSQLSYTPKRTLYKNLKPPKKSWKKQDLSKEKQEMVSRRGGPGRT